MKNNNIILIGFMGSGKTAVGRWLARRLGWRLADVDQNIEDEDGRKIKAIFAVDGEQYFRRLETEALEDLLKFENRKKQKIGRRNADKRKTTGRKAADGLVVSTGGGIVLRPENRRLLKKLGLVAWLQVEPDDVIKRVGRKKDRPLLNVPDKYATIKMILAARRKIYGQAADIKVRTSGSTVKQVGEKVIKAWQKKAK